MHCVTPSGLNSTASRPTWPKPSRRHVLAGLGALGVAGGAGPVRAEGPVDLALVMALDRSRSVSRDVFRFQIRGHAEALRHPELINAIRRGRHGAIAVCAVAWSDPDAMGVLVPWARLASPGDLDRIAAGIAAFERLPEQGATAVGAAIRQSLAVLDQNPFPADREVIDITSNGFSNAAVPPQTLKPVVEARGATVNALVVQDEFDWLEEYYRQQVIAGLGAFVRAVDGFDGFAHGLLAKLLTEIA